MLDLQQHNWSLARRVHGIFFSTASDTPGPTFIPELDHRRVAIASIAPGPDEGYSPATMGQRACPGNGGGRAMSAMLLTRKGNRWL
jgi:hypothetical protein